jgi:hypothetical protein
MTPETRDHDPDFGAMQYDGIGAWDCHICFEFPHPPTYYFAVHVWASETGPSSVQQATLRRLKEKYADLWPSLASTIVDLHPTITKREELAEAMRDWVSVHLGEHSEDSVEFVYDLDLEGEGTRGYFIRLEDWKIVEAVVAE